MNKILVRLVALLLIPCVVVDPVKVYAMTTPAVTPIHAPAPIYLEQAFAARAHWAGALPLYFKRYLTKDRLRPVIHAVHAFFRFRSVRPRTFRSLEVTVGVAVLLFLPIPWMSKGLLLGVLLTTGAPPYKSLFVQGVEEFNRLFDTNAYPALLGRTEMIGTKDIPGSLRPLLAQEFGVDLLFGQAVVTSGNSAAIDQLIGLVADIEGVDLRQPIDRDTVWITPALFMKYEALVNRNARAEMAPVPADKLLDSLMLHPGKLPKVLLLSPNNLRQDPNTALALLLFAASHHMLVIFDATRSTFSSNQVLMNLLSAHENLRENVVLLTDLEERFQEPEARIGALVSFNRSLIEKFKVSVGASNAGKNNYTQFGLNALLQYVRRIGSATTRPSIKSVEQPAILNATASQMAADPTLGITLEATFSADGFSREARENLMEQGIDPDDPRVIDYAKTAAASDRFVLEPNDIEIMARRQGRTHPPEGGWKAVILLIKMWVGQPAFKLAPWVKAAAEAGARLTAQQARALIPLLKKADCFYLFRAYGLTYQDDEMISDAEGSKVALQALAKAYVRLKQKKTLFIIPTPYYVGYDSSLALAGIPKEQIVYVETQRTNNFVATPEDIQRALKAHAQAHGYQLEDREKMLLLTTPDNPTGAIVGIDSLQGLLGYAHDNGMFTVLDAAYGRLLYGQHAADGAVDPVNIQQVAEMVAAERGLQALDVLKQMAVLMTDSKEIIHPGTRRGKLASHNRELIQLADSLIVQRSDKIANQVGLTVYSQENAEMAEAYYNAHVKELYKNKALLESAWARMDLDFVPIGGAFYFFWDTSTLIGRTWQGETITRENFDTIFRRATGVRGVPGKAFGKNGWYRFSTAGATDDVKEAIRRVERFVNEVGGPSSPSPKPTVQILTRIAERIRWLGPYTVHYANKERHEAGRPPESVGGHQSTPASMAELITVVEAVRRPEDHVVMVPHGAPAWYAFLTLMLRKLPLLKNYRMKELPAYPSHRTPALGIANPTVPTGSLGKGPVAGGLGLAATLKYLKDHGMRDKDGTLWVLVGDGEMGEENIVGALRYIKQLGLRNVKFIINLNVQRLDPVVDNGQAERLLGMLRNEGLDTRELKYSLRMRRKVFEEPGGHGVRVALDRLQESDWRALMLKSGADMRERVIGLMSEKERAAGRALLKNFSDEDLETLIRTPAGHDVEQLLSTFSHARDTRESMGFVVWTTKGKGLPGLEAGILNHSQKLSSDQVAALRAASGLQAGEEWSDFPEGSPERDFLDALRHQRETHAIREAAHREKGLSEMTELAGTLPDELDLASRPQDTTLDAFSRTLAGLAKHPVSDRLVALAGDVFASMGFTSWIAQKGVWGPLPEEPVRVPADAGLADYKAPSPRGQSLAFSNSEPTVALVAAAFGRVLELVPIMGIYDEFIALILEMLRYADYWGSRLLLVSLVTSSREGSQHKSVLAPSAIMDLPSGVLFDPAFPIDAHWMILHSLKQMVLHPFQGRIVNLRLSSQQILSQATMYELLREQPRFKEKTDAEIHEAIRPQVLQGAYRLIDYSHRTDYPSASIGTIFATGKVLDQAVEASRRLAKVGIYVNVIYVTSPSLLRNDHRSVERARGRAPVPLSYLEMLVSWDERVAPMVAVTDASPRVLDWMGGALGIPLRVLGSEEFQLSMSRQDMLREAGIDADAIVQALDSNRGISNLRNEVYTPPIQKSFQDELEEPTGRIKVLEWNTSLKKLDPSFVTYDGTDKQIGLPSEEYSPSLTQAISALTLPPDVIQLLQRDRIKIVLLDNYNRRVTRGRGGLSGAHWGRQRSQIYLDAATLFDPATFFREVSHEVRERDLIVNQGWDPEHAHEWLLFAERPQHDIIENWTQRVSAVQAQLVQPALAEHEYLKDEWLGVWDRIEKLSQRLQDFPKGQDILVHKMATRFEQELQRVEKAVDELRERPQYTIHRCVLLQTQCRQLLDRVNAALGMQGIGIVQKRELRELVSRIVRLRVAVQQTVSFRDVDALEESFEHLKSDVERWVNVVAMDAPDRKTQGHAAFDALFTDVDKKEPGSGSGGSGTPAMRPGTLAAGNFYNVLMALQDVLISSPNDKKSIEWMRKNLFKIVGNEVPEQENPMQRPAELLWGVVEGFLQADALLADTALFCKAVERQIHEKGLDRMLDQLKREFVELHEVVLDVPLVRQVMRGKRRLRPNDVIWRKATPADKKRLEKVFDQLIRETLEGFRTHLSAKKKSKSWSIWQVSREGAIKAAVKSAQKAHGAYDVKTLKSGWTLAMLPPSEDSAEPTIVSDELLDASDPWQLLRDLFDQRTPGQRILLRPAATTAEQDEALTILGLVTEASREEQLDACQGELVDYLVNAHEHPQNIEMAVEIDKKLYLHLTKPLRFNEEDFSIIQLDVLSNGALSETYRNYTDPDKHPDLKQRQAGIEAIISYLRNDKLRLSPETGVPITYKVLNNTQRIEVMARAAARHGSSADPSFWTSWLVTEAEEAARKQALENEKLKNSQPAIKPHSKRPGQGPEIPDERLVGWLQELEAEITILQRYWLTEKISTALEGKPTITSIVKKRYKLLFKTNPNAKSPLVLLPQLNLILKQSQNLRRHGPYPEAAAKLLNSFRDVQNLMTDFVSMFQSIESQFRTMDEEYRKADHNQFLVDFQLCEALITSAERRLLNAWKKAGFPIPSDVQKHFEAGRLGPQTQKRPANKSRVLLLLRLLHRYLVGMQKMFRAESPQLGESIGRYYGDMAGALNDFLVHSPNESFETELHRYFDGLSALTRHDTKSTFGANFRRGSLCVLLELIFQFAGWDPAEVVPYFFGQNPIQTTYNLENVGHNPGHGAASLLSWLERAVRYRKRGDRTAESQRPKIDRILTTMVVVLECVSLGLIVPRLSGVVYWAVGYVLVTFFLSRVAERRIALVFIWAVCVELCFIEFHYYPVLAFVFYSVLNMWPYKPDDRGQHPPQDTTSSGLSGSQPTRNGLSGEKSASRPLKFAA